MRKARGERVATRVCGRVDDQYKLKPQEPRRFLACADMNVRPKVCVEYAGLYAGYHGLY